MEKWKKRALDAAEVIRIAEPQKARGLVPECAWRMLEEIGSSHLNWKELLCAFIQEEIVDYSFMPPDRRYDGDFFLPDFNMPEEKVQDILFMVDTSGSICDDDISRAYGEISGAIQQFNGALSGKLGFFDAQVYKPVDFDSIEDVKKIRPRGGGGTDFEIIFDYVNNNLQEPPASIVILTDGYAPFPDEKMSCGIPTLWLLNHDDEDVSPPWGKVVRMK